MKRLELVDCRYNNSLIPQARYTPNPFGLSINKLCYGTYVIMIH